MDIASLVASLPETLSDCKSMSEDIARLKQWASGFTTPQEFVVKALARLQSHKDEVSAAA